METVVRFVTLTARRDRLFHVLLLALAAVALLSSFLGSTALVEQRELTVSYTAWGTRLTVAVGLIVFVCFHVRQAFESREIEVMLSRPVSRGRVVLGYWLGFCVVATVLSAFAAGLVALFGEPGRRALVVWGGTLWLETLIVVAIALFCSFTLRSAVGSVMAALGLYLMGRMTAFFLMMADRTPDLGAAWLSHLVEACVKTIGMIMPRLDFFARSEWLVYTDTLAKSWQPCAIQAAVYLPLLIAASVLDFHKREF